MDGQHINIYSGNMNRKKMSSRSERSLEKVYFQQGVLRQFQLESLVWTRNISNSCSDPQECMVLQQTPKYALS
uniref:Uncharacterized protein n=1 Tax=Arion vulgaris TaxID=1028688 RepID=A0A0B7BBB0_9EUPU